MDDMLKRILLALASLALAISASVLVVPQPALAACGDSTAEWVPSGLLGASAWSGTLDGTTDFTVVLTNANSVAATVIVLDSGAGTWVHDYDLRWSSTAAGIWEYHFEVTPTACSGGMVTEAAGGATDGLSVLHYVTDMTRVL